MPHTVLSVLAHPDDAEFLCAGAMIRLVREHGWQAHIASMTPGDCGSAEMGPEEISRVRRGEGARAAAVLGATYHCLEERDLQIRYNEQAMEKVTGLLRKVRPTLVITHSPMDYMLDHEMTSVLGRAACFAAACPNFLCDRGHARHLEHIPHLYYCDPAEGKDLFGRDVTASIVIDIADVMATKLEMLAAHDSQRNWLRRQHGMDQYLEAMKAWCGKRGQSVGMAYAEGFRQHLGHSYPQDDLLGQLLGRN
jgi:LmbE family N-acetylglucosaminyl deacetylase